MKCFTLARWQDLTRAFTGWTGVALATLLGAVLGTGVFTVFYSGPTEYLGNNPASCANCHAMNEQYEDQLEGPHHDVATYNPCHVPHNDIAYKYINRADNSFWHALRFTFQNHPENIKIRDHNRGIVEAACIDCHGDYVDQAKNGSGYKDERVSYLRYRGGVGHKRRGKVSSATDNNDRPTTTEAIERTPDEMGERKPTIWTRPRER